MCSDATFLLWDWYDHWLAWSDLLTMKHTFVIGSASNASAYPLGQYVVFVRLLYAGSWIARTMWVSGAAASIKGLAILWLDLLQLNWMIPICPIIAGSPG